jgi:hypothetical protein
MDDTYNWTYLFGILCTTVGAYFYHARRDTINGLALMGFGVAAMGNYSAFALGLQMVMLLLLIALRVREKYGKGSEGTP